MFKSTKDYNDAIYTVLTSIREDSSIDSITDHTNTDFNDVINFCIKKQYIIGLQSIDTVDGTIFAGEPRLTYDGLYFIEHFNS